LFFEFPDDAGSLTAPQEYNIMLGNAFKLSINSNNVNVNETSFYFPAGTWCNVLKANGSNTCMKSTGESMVMRTKAYDAYLHLREGYLAPMQDGTKLGEEKNVRTVQGLVDAGNVDFHVLPKCDDKGACASTGRYINDDGETLNVIGDINAYYLKYEHTVSGTDAPTTLTFSVQ